MAAIKIQNLEKTFGIRTIFKNVSFELKRGERLALIGANDAHKMSHWRRRLHGRSRYRSLR